MKVSDIMTKEVKTVSPESSLKEAAQLMRSMDCGALPVCSADRLVGMVTDRDIVVRGVAQDGELTECTVGDVMTTPISYCFESQDTNEVRSILAERKIRRLAVLNRAHRLIGIISLADLAYKMEEVQTLGHTLRKVSEPNAERKAA